MRVDNYERTYCDLLFPDNNRPLDYNEGKLVIFLSGRVHPGESPGSHALNGTINFLLSDDKRAKTLLSMFVFKIIPMLNPDGVYKGHYRKNNFNENLNRYYSFPEFDRQPEIYATRKLIEFYASNSRLFFYCDYHAHAANKGCFLYGNAIDDFVSQVESRLFAKLVSLSSPNFEYEFCNFSKLHMKAKDRDENLSKEGCGRVSVYKIANIIHSFTLECGFHGCKKIPKNKSIIIPGGIEEEVKMNSNENGIDKENSLFTISSYEEVGKTLAITILDILKRNKNPKFQTIEPFRQEIATEVGKVKRFRRQLKIKKKTSKIHDLIHEEYYLPFIQKIRKLESLKLVNKKENRILIRTTNTVKNNRKKSLIKKKSKENSTSNKARNLVKSQPIKNEIIGTNFPLLSKTKESKRKSLRLNQGKLALENNRYIKTRAFSSKPVFMKIEDSTLKSFHKPILSIKTISTTHIKTSKRNTMSSKTKYRRENHVLASKKSLDLQSVDQRIRDRLQEMIVFRNS